MAVTGRYYHLQFQQSDRDSNNTIVQNDIHVRIYDLTLEGDDTIAWEIIELTGSGDPLHTSTVDTGEDKFTGIRPTQATIKFISTSSVTVSSFVDAPIKPEGVDVGDPRWYVEIYKGNYNDSKFIFKGFLNLDDCYEDFMPEKNEVVLVANDALGSLKNIPWTDNSGNNPTGYWRIADILTTALAKTKLSLNLNAIFNIRESSLSSNHFFDVIYLHAKTFEDQIGTCVSCYDVLEKILGEEAFLCQRGGEWWIVRVDELGNNRGYYRAVYDTSGVLQSLVDSSVLLAYGIGKELQDTFFSQEETQVYITREFKFIKETYRFDYPLEIVDNIDFSRGTLIDFNSTTLIGRYNIADWEALEGSGGIEGLGTPSTTQNYIRRSFADTNMTYENERYVVIEHKSAGGAFFIKSNHIPVHKNDKIDVSVDARFSLDVFASSGTYRFNTMQVRLTGIDGTHYTLHGGTSVDKKLEWRVTSGSFTSNNRYFVVEGDLSEDMTQWKTATWITDSKDPNPCPPIPVDGYLEIVLIHNQNSAFQTDRYFSNLRFTYIPYINGSYSKYSGFYYKISRPENYVNTRDKQVFVSDSKKKLFKGSWFKQDGADYSLATNFYSWDDIHTTTPSAEFIHPYAHIQAFDVWNQYRNSLRKFQFTAQGLGWGQDDQFASYLGYPSLIHTYLLQDTSEHTNDRYFMLTSFDIDWYLCEWKGTLIEAYNIYKGKHYDDNLETKYIQ